MQLLDRLLAPWRELPALHAVDRRHGQKIEHLENRMSADRDLLAAAAVCLPVIADGVLALEEKLATALRERDEALGRETEGLAREAADEAGDVEAISPLAQGLQDLAAKFRPAAEAPDTTTPEPPATPEDVVDVVADAPTAGDGSTGEVTA